MKYQIRQMYTEDIDDVIEGENKIFNESLGYDLFYSDLKLNPYANYFVLDIDNRVRGYIGLWIEDSAQIISFYVEKEFQNLGYGTMMLDFVISLSKMSGAKNISLEVRVSNQKAISLYKKQGFKEINIRKNYYKDGEDAIVMNKELEISS